MKYTALSLVSFLLVFSLSAQNVEFKKKNFTDQQGFEEAMTNLKAGDKLFSQQKKWLFPAALEYYLKANNFNPNNDLLNFKIGICYLSSNDKASSLSYFQKAKELNPQVDPKIDYAIAQGLQYNLKFSEAESAYQNFLTGYKGVDKTGVSDVINKKIQECRNGAGLVLTPVVVTVQSMGEGINSKYNDYAPLVSADENLMIFTSRREGSTGGEMDISAMEYFEDIYQVTRENGNWTVPVKLGNQLNTSTHDASVGLSADGLVLFIYKGLTNGGDIYECVLENGNWTVPKPLSSKINSSWHESSACLSPDKNTLYFTSNRSDMTTGQRDIFKSTRNAGGDWSDPVNLGTVINTPYDEEGVTLSNDGLTLYFASTGHNSMGGFDLFRSRFLDGQWTTPENLGYPMNTPDDEVYCEVFGLAGYEHGYFSASRKEGKGEKDLYIFSFEQPVVAEVRKDSADSPDDYKVPIVSGDPANLFVNVENDSTKATADNQSGSDTKSNTENNTNKSATTDVNTGTNQSSESQNNTTADAGSSTGDVKSAGTNQNTDVVFRVQVGASRKQMPYAELHQRYPGSQKVDQEYHDGWYKYLIGEYQTYSDAKNTRLNSGTPDAWVVVYRNGQRVPISEVTDRLACLPNAAFLICLVTGA